MSQNPGGPMGSVCNTCRGKGRVYRGHGRWIFCPDCDQKSQDSHAYKRASALNALAYCWMAYQKGETEDFNLSLAVNGCLKVKITLGEMARKYKIPMDILRKVSEGQGHLSG